MKFSRALLNVLRFSFEVADRLPRRGDPWFTWVIKTAAVADSAQRAYYGRLTVLEDLTKQYNLQRQSCAALVAVLVENEAISGFTRRKFALTEDEEFVEVRSQDGERLFIREFRERQRVSRSAEFYHTPGFDFVPLLQGIWSKFPGGIHVDHAFSEDDAPRPSLMPLPPCSSLLSPPALQLVEEIRTRPPGRTYLLLGQPGSGKSRLIRQFAEGQKLLKFECSCLMQTPIQEVSFLLKWLRPDVVLVDDFDRTTQEDVAKILFLLEFLHSAQPTTLFLTANSVEDLDSALLRAGRVSEILDFGVPEEEERRWFLQTFLRVPFNETHLQLTGGYSRADLVELCECANMQSIEFGLRLVDRIRAVSASASTGSAGLSLRVSGDAIAVNGYRSFHNSLPEHGLSPAVVRKRRARIARRKRQ